MAKHPWLALDPGVAEVLRPGLAGLGEEMIEAIGLEVPDYKRPMTGSFGRGVRRGVEEALARFTDLIEHHETDALGPTRKTYFDLGRGEVRQGRSLDALQSAYRVGARVAWRRVADTGMAAGLPQETLNKLAESIFAYIDELSATSVEGYHQERSAIAGTIQRARRELVETLLRTPPAAPETVEVVARAAEWRLPARVGALVVRDADPDRLAAALGDGAIATVIADASCALIPDPDGPGRARQIERAIGDRTAALGPTVEWGQLARSFQRALRVLELIEAGAIEESGVVAADAQATALLINEDPGLAGELAARRLAPLEQVRPRTRTDLTATLFSWLRHQGRVAEVADELHVHPQTVRYRLRRLRELFGDQLDDPQARFEIELSLRAARPAA